MLNPWRAVWAKGWVRTGCSASQAMVRVKCGAVSSFYSSLCTPCSELCSGFVVERSSCGQLSGAWQREDVGSCAGVHSAAVASLVVQRYLQRLLHMCSYRSGSGLPPTLMCRGTTKRPLTRACSPPWRKVVTAATVATKPVSIWEV